VLQIYRLTRSFPDDEKFGLISQLRRASASIPTNLAEGCRRATDADYAHFVSIARGSAAEVQYLVNLSLDLGFIERTTAVELGADLEQIQRMLTALWKTLQS
jgi:four helix bundle protein